MSMNGCCTGGFSVFAGVGERTREGNDLYKEMIESVRVMSRHLSYILLNCTVAAW